LISPGASWKYNDTGTDLHIQDPAWPSVDDSGWASGSAQLGYGDGDEATVLDFGGDANNKLPCYYFRHTFTVAGPSIFESLTLRVVRDDGCLVFLNGTEVARSNMPAGEISYSTRALSVVGGSGESAWQEFSVNPALLVAGDNVVAVEVHQYSASTGDPVTSSDISFDLWLEGVPPLPVVTLDSPADQSVSNTTEVSFTVSATDAAGLSSATLYIGSGMQTVTFSGPAQTEDAQITSPDAGSGIGTSINVDGENPLANGLIKFLNVFDDQGGPVPLGSTIISATLEVNCTNPGNRMQLYRLTQDWAEDSTGLAVQGLWK